MFAYTLALLRSVMTDRKGVTAMEHGLIASLVAVVIIVGVTAVGTNLNTLFGTIATNL
jgi:pilus assembly protein Flp/PilA